MIVGITWCEHVCVCVQFVCNIEKRFYMCITCFHYLPFTCACCSVWVWDYMYACLRAVNKCEPLRVWRSKGVCVYMCVQQMFCSPVRLVFVAAPSCRRPWPRASLSARTGHTSAALICQLQLPSPAPNKTHSLTESSWLDDAVLLTHTCHAPSLPFSLTPALCRLCHEHRLVSLPFIFSFAIDTLQPQFLSWKVLFLTRTTNVFEQKHPRKNMARTKTRDGETQLGKSWVFM